MLKTLIISLVGKMVMAMNEFLPLEVGPLGNVLNPFDPIVEGNNTCYMATGYFPKDKLEPILPHKMTLPSDALMKQFYPDTELIEGQHPFMLSFCHGAFIHDVYTKINVPQQEELMFVFPIYYDNKHMMSYPPVLYLNSSEGVDGGLYYGLRKEYHPEMKTSQTSDSKQWHIKDIINGAFTRNVNNNLGQLTQFAKQLFINPFVTISYPPFPHAEFYQAKVYPHVVNPSSTTFDWEYKGATITSNNKTPAIYADYFFTMSQPMSYERYFRDSAEADEQILQN